MSCGATSGASGCGGSSGCGGGDASDMISKLANDEDGLTMEDIQKLLKQGMSMDDISAFMQQQGGDTGQGKIPSM